VIPVSCVEQGWWSAASPEFCASPRVHFAAGRAAKVASVSDCLAEGQGAVSDQSDVWHHIAAKAARFRLPESLGALRMALSALHSLPAASSANPERPVSLLSLLSLLRLPTHHSTDWVDSTDSPSLPAAS